MIDVSPKFNTLRYARAEGVLHAKPQTIKLVEERKVPKGDVYEVARAAGIQAAKRTADTIVFCHPLPLDWVEIHFTAKESTIQISAEVKAIWKTGVEMEAMNAVTAALLNAYDMLKPIDDQIWFTDIRLAEKTGGKSNFKEEFSPPLRAAVIVLSDSTFAGKRQDRSGQIIREFLQSKGIETPIYEILPDDREKITKRLISLCDEEKPDLVFTTGGTGFGPKDVTPEAMQNVLEKEAPGIVESIRHHGKQRTPYAMLSREKAGLRGQTLIINLPGSSRGARESLEALFPGLTHIFPMMRGGGHDEHKKK